MKSIFELTRKLSSFACMVIVLALSHTAPAQTATWTGAGGDGEWNTALNWDIGVPAEGTNAVIGGANIVSYNLPMAAGSFGTMTLSGSLSINTNRFTMDPGSTSVVPLPTFCGTIL